MENVENSGGETEEIHPASDKQVQETECIDDIMKTEIKNQTEETENKKESGEVKQSVVTDVLHSD